MNRNVRALILQRLEDLLKEAVGENLVYRNRSDIDRLERPCVILLDGIAKPTGTLTLKSGRGPDTRVDLLELTPFIYLFLKRREEAQAGTRGPEMEEYEGQIVPAIKTDDELKALVGSNGWISFRGLDTDMQPGEAVQGMMLFHFAFQYALDPKDF